MKELRIRFSKENIKKEAQLIRNLASSEVDAVIDSMSDFDVVKLGLIHLARSGRLMEQIGIHFPRRAKNLPKLT